MKIHLSRKNWWTELGEVTLSQTLIGNLRSSISAYLNTVYPAAISESNFDALVDAVDEIKLGDVVLEPLFLVFRLYLVDVSNPRLIANFEPNDEIVLVGGARRRVEVVTDGETEVKAVLHCVDNGDPQGEPSRLTFRKSPDGAIELPFIVQKLLRPNG
ncbi:hypothetical protein HQ571_01600 [Candidatus Kuenenbacteria bacterium]|nr:hypothetical protein [Candidatus Kuenenbacteria bacterium]